VVEHNGGSQGLSALVSFLPDRSIGFAFLANTSPNFMTKIGNAGSLLWPLLLGERAPSTAAASGSTATETPPKIREETASSPVALPAVDDLIARMVAAHGGERNLQRHSRIEVHARKVYENQGVHADLMTRASAPSSREETESWTAAGKWIGHVRTYFDGSRGGQETTFGQDSTLSAGEIEQTRRRSSTHVILDLRNLYSEVTVEREDSVNGEGAYILKLRPKRGSSVSLFVSSRTALILQQQSDGETLTFGDYRNIDGEFMPFRTTIRDALGEATIEVSDVRFNGAISPAAFGPAPK
jgi:hypothetical protein